MDISISCLPCSTHKYRILLINSYYTCTCVHTHACTHRHTHTHTHIYIYTHTQRLFYLLVKLHTGLLIFYDYISQGDWACIIIGTKLCSFTEKQRLAFKSCKPSLTVRLTKQPEHTVRMVSSLRSAYVWIQNMRFGMFPPRKLLVYDGCM